MRGLPGATSRSAWMTPRIVVLAGLAVEERKGASKRRGKLAGPGEAGFPEAAPYLKGHGPLQPVASTVVGRLRIGNPSRAVRSSFQLVERSSVRTAMQLSPSIRVSDKPRPTLA